MTNSANISAKQTRNPYMEVSKALAFLPVATTVILATVLWVQYGASIALGFSFLTTLLLAVIAALGNISSLLQLLLDGRVNADPAAKSEPTTQSEAKFAQVMEKVKSAAGETV